MKKIFSILFIFQIALSFSQPLNSYLEDKDKAPRAHNVDMQNLALDVKFDTKNGKVLGTVTHTFQPLQKNVDTLFLDAPGITIFSVKMDQKELKFKSISTGVIIYFSNSLDWNKKYTIDIKYEAQPAKGIYFVGWNDPKQISRKQIWTQGQSTDHRYWIPMYDGLNDKVTTEMKITFDNAYQVLSNGNLVNKKENKADNTITWHYKLDKPHPNYLMMLAIGDYKVHTMESKRGVKLNLLYYPDWEDRVKYAYMYYDEMMDFMEKETGVLYPWGKTYSQVPVQEFMYGAMENTTATLFGDFLFVDKRAFEDGNYVNVNMHELAHQWFGDLVTARSAPHHWLQESFATYYGALFEREKFGEDYYALVRSNQMYNALRASRNDDFPIAHSQAGSARNYPKGAVVLAMLRNIIGDEEFQKSIQHYLNRHAFKNAVSSDLLYAFHETLGVDLDWFWEQWIYKGGEPHYKISYEQKQRNNKSFTDINVEQIHEQKPSIGLFKMPIVFQVHYADGTFDEQKAWVQNQTDLISIANPQNKEIDFVLFDPNNEVLKTVTFRKPTKELLLQAEKAPQMIDRLWALQQLEGTPLSEKRATFELLLKSNQFYAIKREILSQIEDQDEALTLLGLQSENMQVRKAAVESLGHLTDQEEKIVATFLNDENASYDLLEQALKLLINKNPAKTKEYLDKTEGLIGTGRSFRTAWLALGIKNGYHKTLFIEELTDLTSSSYGFDTRTNAMFALLDVGVCNQTIANNIIEATKSNNNRLKYMANIALNQFKEITDCKQYFE